MLRFIASRYRHLFWGALTLLALLVVFIAIDISSWVRHLKSTEHKRLVLMSVLLEQATVLRGEQLDRYQLAVAQKRLQEHIPGLTISFCSAQGQILFGDESAAVTTAMNYLPKPLPDGSRPLIFWGPQNGDSLVFVAPVTNEQSSRWVISMPAGPARRMIAGMVVRDTVTAVIIFLVAVGLLLFWQRRMNYIMHSYATLQSTQGERIQSERMQIIGQMAAAISHDLRNPLTGIKMAVYYLRSRYAGKNEELTGVLDDVDLEVDYASNVVSNILTYARPIKLISAMVSLNKVVTDASRLVLLQIRNTGVRITYNLTPELPLSFFDEKYIKQVVVNLLNNAIRASSSEGEIVVSTRSEERFLELTVQDFGGGIPEPIKDKVFLPFFTTRAKGVGLGLTIVYNIVRQHQGTVTVDSEPGKGTTVTVRIPLMKKTMAGNPPAEPSQPEACRV